MRAVPRRGDGGFTLLELLVALALLATVGALAFGALRGGARVWERRAEAGAEPLALAARIEALLGAALLAPVPQPGLARIVPFAGTGEAVTFLGTGPRGLAAYRLAFVPEGGGSRLRLWRRPVAAPAHLLGPIDWGPPEAELAGLPPARLAYAGPDGALRADWPAGPRAPALVRLRLGGPGPAREVTVALRSRP